MEQSLTIGKTASPCSDQRPAPAVNPLISRIALGDNIYAWIIISA
jgi:hypothetical protein